MSAKTDKIDPSQPLANARHEAFAVAWAKGAGPTEAYRQAGYRARDADTAGPRLSGNVGIKSRKEWFQRQTATATVLTVIEKREFCARVVRAKLKDIPDDSDLWQEVRITDDSIVKKLPCKLRTIQLDNDLAGEGSEAAMKDKITVNIGEWISKSI